MGRWAEKEIYGWGRYPRGKALVARPETRRDIEAAVKDRDGSPVLAQGMRRSYGDAALLLGCRVIDFSHINRMLAFDEREGWLRCEAGVTIAEIVDTFLPRGWFPPVVPGTKHVTVGGALASDIHGKNHHVAGTWSDHVRRVELMTATGEVVVCDRDTNPDLFWATAGGQGLTGLILAMDVRLSPAGKEPNRAVPGDGELPAIAMESVRVPDLATFLEASAASSSHTFTVGWLDGTSRGKRIGRGVLMRGDWSPTPVRARRRRPPKKSLARYLSSNWLINPATVKAFNGLYYYRHRRETKMRTIDADGFFFPLDAVAGWNAFYGRRGFLQYQFVVPDKDSVRNALETIASAGTSASLGVIKEFGNRANGGLSFPAPGITVALDFPNTGSRLLELLERLDDVVAGAGGRVYLAKDARLGRDQFRRMYPDWARWKSVRDAIDPNGVFQSDLGRRLGLVGEPS